MPSYKFACGKCKLVYEDLVDNDPKGKYASVVCPECGSKKKKQLPTACNFIFAQPEGTSRDGSHQYRYDRKKESVALERETAQQKSHMGSDPYNEYSQINDLADGKNYDFENL